MKIKFTIAPTFFLLVVFSGNSLLSQVPDSIYPSLDTDIPHHTEWTKTHYPEKIAEFKIDPLNCGDIIFIGNSITEGGGNWGERFGSEKVRNRGISGDVTEGVLARLGEIHYSKPASVFILIGINDLTHASLSAEFVSDNIIKIAASIKEHTPGTKIYVQTVLPTSISSLVGVIKATNERVRNAASSGNYSVIDLYELFADQNDMIIAEFTTDGIHLTEEGYNLWVSTVAHLISSSTYSTLTIQ